jgi:glycine/D-amino acid oxidase-like deaminating enzyme
LPLPPVFGLKGHSLVFETGTTIPGEAVFLEYRERSGTVLAPELFPRTDGTTYVCAISSEEPLPMDPTRVAPDPGAIERLEALCGSLSPVLASAKILVRQACYRPVTCDGLPDRPRDRNRRRLCRHRAQRLGHSQRAGDPARQWRS